MCDIHSSYHVKKNTSSSSSFCRQKLCVFRERERERANTKRDRQTEEEADVVSFLVPLEERRPFEIIIIIVSELSERATSSFYLIPLRGPITLVFVICFCRHHRKEKKEREREKTTTTKKTLDARKTRKRISTSGPQMSNQAVILLRNQLRGERNGGVCPKSCFFVRDDDDVITQRRGGGGKSSSLFFSLTASFANWWCFFFPFREETPR